MKHSIARKITLRVLLLLLAALTVLFIGTYYVISTTIDEADRKYSRSMVSVYSDLISTKLRNEWVDIDSEEGRQIIKEYGEYMCTWYHAEYAYAYIPDIKNSKVMYIHAAHAKTVGEQEASIDGVYDYVLTKEELAVWNMEEMFAIIETNTRFGHEISTEICIKDPVGHKFIVGVDYSYAENRKKIFNDFVHISAMIVAVLLGVFVAVRLLLERKVSRPAKVISEKMNDFITNGERSGEKLNVIGNDEYAMIANAFNSMTDNIDKYVNHINDLSRTQERQATEIGIASRIQQGFLPDKTFFEKRYDIYASMTPAKDVGGDLYDYFRLDGDRVFVVVADVSGKGIPAAIFMAVTLMLMRQYAKMNLMPSEILRRINDTLSEKNAAMLFATAFVGIYDGENNTFTYSNAGHNPPYIISDGIKTLDGARGTLLGLFTGEDYTDETVKINTGETLFIYTDGVNEATNANNEFYGEKRLENALRLARQAHTEDIIKYVCDDVASFVGEAEQHDDLTVMTLKAKKTDELFLDFDINEFEKIKEKILSIPAAKSQKLELCLAAEERFVNICSYAFPDGVPDGEKIRFVLETTDWIKMRLEDGGVPFDPSVNIADPDDYDIDTQIGGLGNFIAKQSVDDVSYEYKNGKNITIFTKYIEEETK